MHAFQALRRKKKKDAAGLVTKKRRNEINKSALFSATINSAASLQGRLFECILIYFVFVLGAGTIFLRLSSDDVVFVFPARGCQPSFHCFSLLFFLFLHGCFFVGMKSRVYVTRLPRCISFASGDIKTFFFLETAFETQRVRV